MKKSIIRVLTVIALLVFAAGITGAATNLVQNGSFEEGTGPTPAFWQTEAWDNTAGVTDYKVESGNAHSGSKFVTIINNKTNDSRFRQDVNVSENKMYKLSCWIKASKISKDNKGANLSIHGKLESSADVWDSNGNWQQVEMYAKTGPGITSIPVTVGIGTYGSTNTGRASFDDVVVEEVTSIPEGVTVCNLAPEQQSNNNNGNGGASNAGSNFTSLVGWILFAGIFIVIIGFILYRSVTNVSGRGAKQTDSADEEAEKSQPGEKEPAQEESPANTEKEKNKSDDLL